ncbi:unnamed protein product [Plutella xylostella]|uniref:(diamondback moth) hypothetical protein n=1 Tax=Plutella xylostella TaxID=51655 RepID=A0A8S4EJA2_PLUXY|nr:unnamed protein product [Plutella xylostella]
MFVRYRLQWDAMKYSMYSTYGIAIHSLSCLFCISVFSRRWGLHDSMLCLISVASKCAGSIMIAFVQTDFQMFMVPLVEILNSTTFTCLRSMASKLVEKEEMGKMNSLFSLVETLAALVFDPAYSAMYFATLSAFTGAVFLFSASMTVPAMLLLILVETLAALVFDPAYSAMYFATLSAFTGAVFLFSASMTVPAMLLLILVETLAALVFDPAYSAMYFATLSAFTGAVFLFSASMTVPAMLLLIWFFWQHRKETRQKRLELIDGKEDAIEEIKKGRIPQMAKSV